MKRFLVALSLAAALTAGSVPSAVAQSGSPSAKTAIQIGDIVVLNSNSVATDQDNDTEGLQTDWETIMFTSIKTSSQKDLVLGVSLESGLFTKTLVKSKSGTSDTSTATAGVEIRVLVDGSASESDCVDDGGSAPCALPGVVTFNQRAQTLTAVFQGLLTDDEGNVCLSADPETGAITIDEDCLRPEEVELILSTMSANHFNFALNDVGVGVHQIEVQARINLGATSTTGAAEARATLGKGSVVVEEVRLVKDQPGLIIPIGQ